MPPARASARSSGSSPRWAARTRSSSTPTPTPTRPCPAIVAQRVRLRRPEVLGRVPPDRPRRRLRRRSSSGSSAHAELMELGHPRDIGRQDRPGDRRRRPRAAVADATSTPPTGSGSRSCAGRRARGRLVRRADDRRPTCRASDPLATDEIFGPVLVVVRAPTHRRRHRPGQRHRLRAHRRRLQPLAGHHRAGPPAELRAGNVYLNRGTTGAVVGRQPFGGYGLSGVGSKAGGPDYLAAVLSTPWSSPRTPCARASPPTSSPPSCRPATDGEPRPARRGGPRS